MSTHRTCAKCGKTVDPAVLSNFCLQCLLDSAANEDAQAATHSRGTQSGLGRPSSHLWSEPLGRFADYDLLEEVARGGMGVVYKAWQRSLQRTVAVKMVLSGRFASQSVADRFKAEAIAAALLRHPHIVAVHEVGLHEGQPFFSMDFVEGKNLAQLVGHRPLPPKQAARYVRQIAEAIHYAHDHAVLHRDLKPSNVLIDSVTDEARVTDFGLAKRLDGDFSLTVPGQILGSPNFMAPEQASPGHGKVGRQSDAYGLGAILYFLLTARAPFQSESLPALVNDVANTEPVPPCLLNRHVPRDLETICLKCLEKDPNRRYSTARDLAQDLGRYLDGQPVHARPTGPAGRFWRWCRRRPLVASLILALHLALMLGFGGVLWQWRQAVASRLSARQHQYVADMNLVKQVWEEGRLKSAQELLAAYTPQRGEADLRGFEWRYLAGLCRDESLRAFTNFTEAVTIVASPDSRNIIACSGRAVEALDYAGGSESGPLLDPKRLHPVNACAVSPQFANVLAVGSVDATRIWDLTTGQMVAKLGARPQEGASTLAFSPDGKLLACCDNVSGTLSLWHVERQTNLWFRHAANPLCSVVFAPGGKGLVTGGGEVGNPVFWDLATGQASPFPVQHQAWVSCLDFSPDGRWLATGANDNTVVVWEFAKRRLVTRLFGHNGYITAVKFSPDGRYLVSGSSDSTLRLWELASGAQKALYRGHRAAITSICISPDGNLIVSGSLDRTVRVWNTSPLARAQMLRGDSVWVSSVEFSPDSRLLASTDGNHLFFKLWDVSSRIVIKQLPGSTEGAVLGVFSPDGGILAIGSGEGIVRLWDTKTLVPCGFLTNGFDSTSLAFSPKQKILAVAGGGLSLEGTTNRLKFWNLTTQEEMNKLAHAANRAHAVAFSNDGRMVAIGYFDGTVRLWDFYSESLRASFQQRRSADNPVWGVTFSPDDRLVASCADDGTVALYDVRSRQAFEPLREHLLRVWRVAFATSFCKRMLAACVQPTGLKC